MSVNSILKEKSSKKNELQNAVKVSENSMDKLKVVPKVCNDDYYCSVSAIAFDYMTKFITACIISKERYKYLLDLVAYKGLVFLKPILKHKEYASYESLYEDALSYIMEYVYSKADSIENLFDKTSEYIELNAYKKFIHDSSSYDYIYKLDKEKLINYAIFFAKLEIIYNTKTMIKDTSYLTSDENELTNDLIKRCNSFKEDLIKLNSEKIY